MKVTNEWLRELRTLVADYFDLSCQADSCRYGRYRLEGLKYNLICARHQRCQTKLDEINRLLEVQDSVPQ